MTHDVSMNDKVWANSRSVDPPGLCWHGMLAECGSVTYLPVINDKAPTNCQCSGRKPKASPGETGRKLSPGAEPKGSVGEWAKAQTLLKP